MLASMFFISSIKLFFPFMLLLAPSSDFLTSASSFFPSSNSVDYVCTEFLIQTAESEYFGDWISEKKISMYLTPYIKKGTTSSLMKEFINKPLCLNSVFPQLPTFFEKTCPNETGKASPASSIPVNRGTKKEGGSHLK